MVSGQLGRAGETYGGLPMSTGFGLRASRTRRWGALFVATLTALSFARTGALPHHEVARVEGIEQAADINPYNLPDTLHPADPEGGARK